MGFSVSMGKSQILGRLLYDYHSHGSKYEKARYGGHMSTVCAEPFRKGAELFQLKRACWIGGVSKTWNCTITYGKYDSKLMLSFNACSDSL